MITAADAEFHAPSSDTPTWAETNYFGFYDVESGLTGGIYLLFRPNLGVVTSLIVLNTKQAITPWGADFVDLRNHLAIPEPRSLHTYALDNGLRVETVVPNHTWNVTYDDGEGTTIDIVHAGLMEPYDINDPEQDPITAATLAKAKNEGFQWGTAYKGHFDTTGKVTGTVSVRGKHYSIDCVATMDHSWGPRPERGIPEMSWMHAHFSENYAIHALYSFDASTGGGEYQLAHGYVLEDGQVYGLVGGFGTTKRDENKFPDQVFTELTDARGIVHRLDGTFVNGYPWLFWMNMVGFTSFMKFTDANGNVGWGEAMDLCELPTLTAPRDQRKVTGGRSH